MATIYIDSRGRIFSVSRWLAIENGAGESFYFYAIKCTGAKESSVPFGFGVRDRFEDMQEILDEAARKNGWTEYLAQKPTVHQVVEPEPKPKTPSCWNRFCTWLGKY